MGAIKGDIVNGILTCMWLFSVGEGKVGVAEGEGHWCEGERSTFCRCGCGERDSGLAGLGDD